MWWRVFTARLSASSLGQPVVIFNKPGAGGMIAAQSTATAAPDGYTIQMANSGHVIAGQLSKNLSFDAVGDFAGIVMVGEAPAVVAVSPKLNAKNLQDFVAMVKAKPGAMNYGSGGVGSATHLAGASSLQRRESIWSMSRTRRPRTCCRIWSRAEFDATFHRQPSSARWSRMGNFRPWPLAPKTRRPIRFLSDRAVGRRRLPLLHLVRVPGAGQDPPGRLGEVGGSVRRSCGRSRRPG